MAQFRLSLLLKSTLSVISMIFSGDRIQGTIDHVPQFIKEICLYLAASTHQEEVQYYCIIFYLILFFSDINVAFETKVKRVLHAFIK